MSIYIPNKLIEVSGSLLSTVGYYTRYSPLNFPRIPEDTLIVEFKKTNEWYIYWPVPETVVQDMLDADSAGKFFMANIRDNPAYSVSKLGETGWVPVRASQMANKGTLVDVASTEPKKLVEAVNVPSQSEATQIIEEFSKKYPHLKDYIETHQPSTADDQFDDVTDEQFAKEQEIPKPAAKKLTPKQMFNTSSTSVRKVESEVDE